PVLFVPFVPPDALDKRLAGVKNLQTATPKGVAHNRDAAFHVILVCLARVDHVLVALGAAETRMELVDQKLTRAAVVIKEPTWLVLSHLLLQDVQNARYGGSLDLDLLRDAVVVVDVGCDGD